MANAASLFLSWGVCFSYVLQAQTPMGLPPCGTDAAHQELLGSSAFYAARQSTLEGAWLEEQPLLEDFEVLEVPVVVHVIHRGSPVGVDENISDAQVLSALVALNEDFRKVAGSNGDGLGVDVFVEFVLAKRTPEGTPTTGIVRVDGTVVPGYAANGMASSSFLPGADQVAVKSLTTWYGDDYLNVFVVPEINGNNGGGGVQGFSYTGPTGDARDGVTLLYNAFGTTGTLKPGRTLNRTLTHEVGHHLSLLHTFYDTDDCGTESDCTTAGDRVCDTPVTLENGTCSTGTCPGAQLENYLDYTPTSCRNTFTAGQRARMRTCLETVRSSLLESLGAVPVVDVDLRPVAVDATSVCTPTWNAVLSVQNQGVLPAPGATIHRTVNGIPLSPVTFLDSIPAGTTVDLALPEVLLLGTSTSWTFTVALPDGTDPTSGPGTGPGTPDAFPTNDTLTHVLTYTGDDRWHLALTTDFFGTETSWSVLDSTGATLWSGDGYGFGENTYLSQACIPPGCHTLVVQDSGGDGMALGGSLTLTNATGDTLAHLAPGTNFGTSVTFDVCASTPPYFPGTSDPGDGDGPDPCSSCPGDLNGDGLVQLNDLLDFLIAFGQPCGP